MVLIDKQIAELQSAATKKTEDTKELAAPLQGVITTLEKAAVETRARLRRATLLSGAAMAVSVCAVGVAIAAPRSLKLSVGYGIVMIRRRRLDDSFLTVPLPRYHWRAENDLLPPFHWING